MRKFIIFLSFILFIQAVNGQQVQYFRSVSLDGRYQFRGHHPVSQVTALGEWVFGLEYGHNGELRKVVYLRKGRPFFHATLGAAQVLISRVGPFETREYRNARGLPVSNAHGISYQRLRYNENNHPVNLYHYNKNGLLCADGLGVSAYTWLTDEQGRRVKSLRFDMMGNRIPDTLGRWELEMEWDSLDNLARVLYKDSEGKLRLVDGVTSGVIFGYTPNGDRSFLTRLGPDGQPSAGADGIQTVTWTYDELGRVKEKQNLDSTGKPAPDTQGVAIYRWDYNTEENFSREWYHDTMGELCFDDSGISMRKDVWFEQDNERLLLNYGLSINPNFETLSAEAKLKEERFQHQEDPKGIAVYRWAYDDDLNILEEKFFNSSYQNVADDKGVMIYRRSFTALGQIQEERYFGSWDRPIVNLNGYAASIWEYDAQGRMIRRNHLGLDGNLKEDKTLTAAVIWDYNERGLPTRQTNLGIWDQIKEDSWGVASYSFDYDKFGNVVEQSHFGIDSLPSEDISGVHLYRWTIHPAGKKELIGRFSRMRAPSTEISAMGF